jgi:hypothetical protein
MMRINLAYKPVDIIGRFIADFSVLGIAGLFAYFFCHNQPQNTLSFAWWLVATFFAFICSMLVFSVILDMLNFIKGLID